MAGEREAIDDAATALQRRLDEMGEDPECEFCSGTADFFLYEPDRVAKFVCWEHVSPLSAIVDEEAAGADRPVAVPLSEEFS